MVAAGLVFAATSPVARVEQASLNPWHHYEFLAEGFARGHTYLSVDPPQELLALENPYLPSSLPEKRLWDASLYHGKYYLYFGPAPAAVLMLPWRLVTGHGMPQWVAAGAWAVIGLAGLFRLLSRVRDRYFPGVSALWLGFVAIVAFHASWFPVLLRRPAVWELPIVAAVACAWWSLAFLYEFHASGGRLRWGVLAGIALGVLIGSRVTYLFSAALVLSLMLVPTPAAGGRIRFGQALAASGLVALAGLSLLAYNHARFGSWTEFGTSFQLWGADYRGTRFMDPRYILFNAWTYLLSTPNFGPYFPFIHPTWPDRFPSGHMGMEEMHGILFAMPVHVAALGSVFLLVRRARDPQARPLVVTLLCALGISLLAAAILFTWGGLCSRYIAELCAGPTVLTAVGLLRSRPKSSPERGSGRDKKYGGPKQKGRPRADRQPVCQAREGEPRQRAPRVVPSPPQGHQAEHGQGIGAADRDLVEPGPHHEHRKGRDRSHEEGERGAGRGAHAGKIPAPEGDSKPKGKPVAQEAEREDGGRLGQSAAGQRQVGPEENDRRSRAKVGVEVPPVVAQVDQVPGGAEVRAVGLELIGIGDRRKRGRRLLRQPGVPRAKPGHHQVIGFRVRGAHARVPAAGRHQRGKPGRDRGGGKKNRPKVPQAGGCRVAHPKVS